MAKIKTFILIFLTLIYFVGRTDAWIHRLKLLNDVRRHIAFTTSYGFLQGGTLDVNVSLFSYHSKTNFNVSSVFGFSLDKSRSSSVLTTMANSPICHWEERGKSVQSVNFRFDLPNSRIVLHRLGQEVKGLTIVSTERRAYLSSHGLAHPDLVLERSLPTESPAIEELNKSITMKNQRKRRDAKDDEDDDKASSKPPKEDKEDDNNDKVKKKDDKKEDEKANAPKEDEAEEVQYIPMTRDGNIFRTHFLVHIKEESEEGLYSLFFHNCLLKPHPAPVNLSVDIIQDNNGNFLSADEMPIPAMYFTLAVVYFLLASAWLSVLRKSEEGVYKLHYLMLVVVLFKGLSCLFHGVNLFMIGKTGIHLDAWAILWYIVYLMRGALMFLTILLIGAGWVFIKHVFTDKEKKLFLIVIPLQILDNVAWVIMEESEEGMLSYDLWHKVFIGFDLVCCFTILFPVIWSIRHLQEASKTDGKAAVNLVKLKLFRHYYFLVVCYIYFTRIIKYFLEITLPFHFGWLGPVMTETFLLVFYIMIGYKFRPMSHNPYLQVPQEDEEELLMEEVLTKTGNTENLTRVNQRYEEEEEVDTSAMGAAATTTLKQRESSHEYD